MALIENLNCYPYFPLKLRRVKNEYLIRNPINGNRYKINQDTFNLLQYCDGQSSYSEIIRKLVQIYQTEKNQVLLKSKEILRTLSGDGILWIRRSSMRKWQLDPPNTIFWNLTNRCNLSCFHCAVESGKPNKRELNLDDSFRFIDEISSLGVKNIIFTGGEPLINASRFFKIAASAKSHNLDLQLATNGTLITNRIAIMLRKLGLKLHISLNGTTPLIHDKICCVRGAWEKVMEGINHLRNNDIPFLVNTIVTKVNIHQIPLIYDLAIKVGAQFFRIIPFIPFGRGQLVKDLEVSPQDMKDLCINLRERENKEKVIIKRLPFDYVLFPPLESSHLKSQIGCNGARHYCTLTSTGNILPCNYFLGVKTDNIRKRSFSWIWKNSHFLNYFRSLNTADFEGKCKKCSWFSVCRGGCIAVNYVQKNIFQSNSQCWQNDSEKINLTIEGY